MVEETLKELGCADKPSLLVFNKIDAYTWVEKEEDDLTPIQKENYTLEDLKKTWMAKSSENQHYLECMFISAKQKENIDHCVTFCIGVFVSCMFRNIRITTSSMRSRSEECGMWNEECGMRNVE